MSTGQQRRRSLVGAGILAVLPWTWFAIRDAPLGAFVEVLAIMLPVLAVAVAVAAGVYAYRRRCLPALVLAVSTLAAGAVATVGPWLPHDAGEVGGRGVTIVAANVDGRDGAAETLGALTADVIVVPEVGPDVVAALTPRYPHRYVRIDGNDDPDIAVFSRYPLRVLEPVGPSLPGARVEIAGPDGRFVLYGLHVPRPWFTGESESKYQATAPEHRRLVKGINERLRAETLPVVLAGDLNSVDRERDYRVNLGTGLVDAMRDAHGAPTSVGKWLPLLGRIDHILVSEGWCGDGARRVVLPESSHRAVMATVGPCVVPRASTAAEG